MVCRIGDPLRLVICVGKVGKPNTRQNSVSCAGRCTVGKKTVKYARSCYGLVTNKTLQNTSIIIIKVLPDRRVSETRYFPGAFSSGRFPAPEDIISPEAGSRKKFGAGGARKAALKVLPVRPVTLSQILTFCSSCSFFWKRFYFCFIASLSRLRI